MDEKDVIQSESTRMNYKDRYAMQMCYRMTNGFVKILTQDSLNKDIQGEINRKIDTIIEVTYYKLKHIAVSDMILDDKWIVRITTKEPPPMFLDFDESWQAERLTHELTLLITDTDIVNDVLRRNQKIIDDENAK